MKPKLIVILGPTASGKTALSMQLAEIYPVEIVSADSRQIYRGMDIGTAKATEKERASVTHHMLDLIEPDQVYSVSDFVATARPIIRSIASGGKLPLLVGGTGLYIKGMTEGILDAPGADEALRTRLLKMERDDGPGTLHRLLAQVDERSAESIHPNNLVRIVRALEVFELTGKKMSEVQQEHGFAEKPFEVLKIGVLPPRHEHEENISTRTKAMYRQGLVEEVQALRSRGFTLQNSALKTLGYRETCAYLDGVIDFDAMVETVRIRTRQYAKRQMTWFRKDPDIIWVDSCREFVKIRSLIENFMHI